MKVGVDKRNLIPSPTSPEAVKKLLQIERAGRDIGKVLQRYLFALTTHDEKFQPSPLLGERCYICPSNDRICKTLKIFLPDHRSQFFHSFPSARGGDVFGGFISKMLEENSQISMCKNLTKQL
jgi:hypothetical protein